MAEFSRPIILRARRDTLALVIAATGVTFVLSHALHQTTASPIAATPAPPPVASAAADTPREEWAGHLADPTMLVASVGEDEPLSSASLVVPPSDLSLPTLPVRPLVKIQPCRGCQKAKAAEVASIPPVPPARPAATRGVARAATSPERVAMAESPPMPQALVPVAASAAAADDLLPPADVAPRRPHNRSLMTRLNPFSHLNDAARIGQPLAVAGNAVSAMFRRF